MRVLFLALLVSVFASTANAEMFQSSQGHLCSRDGPDELVTAAAKSDYKEVVVATSFSGKTSMIYHWLVNVDTGTWSVIRQTSTNTACITDTGTSWVRDGDVVVSILDPHSMLMKITVSGDNWLVSIQQDPESPLTIGVDGGSQWEWVIGPSPAGFRI